MLRLSKRADYALMAMKHLAAREPDRAASTREIAQAYDIPVELLAKVLQRLARAGLLTSQQGIHGGYQLSRPAASVSIAQVIEAIDGPLRMTACSEGDESCDQYSRCNVRDPLWRIKNRIVSTLSESSIADLADEVGAMPAPLAVHVRSKRESLAIES
ncbi:MAG: SUF system Fe-S cluster assembly regulator [Acidobacteria bacterium]|nr:SUF system Fe-S cluster assembly regulator [Acidobacteriota bacterium]MBI3263531.1 SUF system Fe-S cluster assembly regulator [Acidobacteriota bacterium]